VIALAMFSFADWKRQAWIVTIVPMSVSIEQSWPALIWRRRNRWVRRRLGFRFLF
jgi:hypothetical protein